MMAVAHGGLVQLDDDDGPQMTFLSENVVPVQSENAVPLQHQASRQLQQQGGGVVNTQHDAGNLTMEDGHFVAFYHAVPGHRPICWRWSACADCASHGIATAYAEFKVVRFNVAELNVTSTVHVRIYEGGDDPCDVNASSLVGVGDVDFHETNVNIFGFGVDADGTEEYNIHRNGYQGPDTTDTTFAMEAVGFESCEFYLVTDDDKGHFQIDLATSQRGTGDLECADYAPYPVVAVQCRTLEGGYAESAYFEVDLEHLCADTAHDFIVFGQAGANPASPYALQIGFVQGAYCDPSNTCAARLAPTLLPSTTPSPTSTPAPIPAPTLSLPPTASPAPTLSAVDAPKNQLGACASNLRCKLLDAKVCQAVTFACSEVSVMEAACGCDDATACFDPSLRVKPACCSVACPRVVGCEENDYCAKRPDKVTCDQVPGDCSWVDFSKVL